MFHKLAYSMPSAVFHNQPIRAAFALLPIRANAAETWPFFHTECTGEVLGERAKVIARAHRPWRKKKEEAHTYTIKIANGCHIRLLRRASWVVPTSNLPSYGSVVLTNAASEVSFSCSHRSNEATQGTSITFLTH